MISDIEILTPIQLLGAFGGLWLVPVTIATMISFFRAAS